MERLFLREKSAGKRGVYERTKIGVYGTAAGVGATFIACGLAYLLAGDEERSVAYADLSSDYCGRPLLYDSLGFEKRFCDRDYFDFFKALEDGVSLRDRANIEKRVNWALKTKIEPQKGMREACFAKLRLANNIKGDTIVCDIGGNACDCLEILRDMDVLVAVADPLPSRLLAASENLRAVKAMEEKGKTVGWLINRNNSGVNLRELSNFLKLREEAVNVPEVPRERICACEYACVFPLSDPEIFALCGESFSSLAHKIFT